jgi:DNA-binding HxlR family transcriptional regulator
MKKNIYILFIFFANLTFSQESEKRIYEISVINRPQTIELIEYENGKYDGNVVTEITKGKLRTNWLNRTWRNLWKIESEEIIDKNPINEKVVEKLMNELKENGIETIKKCSEVEKCNNLMYLDGGTVGFKVKTQKINRKYEFGEIYPLSEKNKEKIELRFEAQNLITILYKQIDLNQKFSNLFKRLPRGYYHWYQASGHSIVTIKNRKRKN